MINKRPSLEHVLILLRLFPFIWKHKLHKIADIISTIPMGTSFRHKPMHECSKKLHLQSYLEMLWSETGYFGLLGNNIILVIILLDIIER